MMRRAVSTTAPLFSEWNGCKNSQKLSLLVGRRVLFGIMEGTIFLQKHNKLVECLCLLLCQVSRMAGEWFL